MHREVAPSALLREDFAAPALRITGDPRLLFQAISNLISNAIKYSAPGSPIDVGIEDGGDHVRIVVSDAGIGIPDKDRAHLFERYFRGSNVSDIAGTGVGLYLVDMVAKLHGGQAGVACPQAGGSRFTLVLPKALQAPGAMEAQA